MHKKQESTEREVERTLACLEDIETIGPSPYFYTRLAARLEEPIPAGESFLIRLFQRPAFKPALVAALILINVTSALILFRGEVPEQQTREENLAAVAQLYGLVETNAVSGHRYHAGAHPSEPSDEPAMFSVALSVPP